MPHVKVLSFHSCRDDKLYKVWNKLISRKDKLWHGVGKNTKVCSNHFELGQPFPDSPNPTLYMKGYDLPEVKKRKPPQQRTDRMVPEKKQIDHQDHSYTNQIGDGAVCSGICQDDEEHECETPTSDYSQQDLLNEHGYSQHKYEVCDSCSPVVVQLVNSMKAMQAHIDNLEQELTSTKEELQISQKHNHKSTCSQDENSSQVMDINVTHSPPYVTINDIKDSSALMYLHTGIQNYTTFQWILQEISHGAKNMHYYRGSDSHTLKQYQRMDTKKPGKERKLGQENELLMTLMRLKLDLLDEYIAFIFGVSESTVSQILSTWIPLLSRELSGLIYWPTQEEIKQAYPKCFHRYDTVRAIIDYTDVGVQKPSQCQFYQSDFQLLQK
jgi:hypothetical protein